eukprot:s5718_g3.t1
MSFTVFVGLLNGKTAIVNTRLDEDVAALQRRAQIELGVGRGRLLDSSGCVLEACALIKHSTVRDGDSLTLLSNPAQARGNCNAFAVILGDGPVVTWGLVRCGGDSFALQSQLKNVRQIQAAYRAFAAVLGDGTVVAWGDAEDGGDSTGEQSQLKDVQQIQATRFAFAAILRDGSVVGVCQSAGL